MKQYQEVKDWEQDPAPITGYTHAGMTIPPANGNRHYMAMLQEVEAGEAEILPAVEPPPPLPTPDVVEADVVASKKFVVLDGEGNPVDITAALLALGE